MMSPRYYLPLLAALAISASSPCAGQTVIEVRDEITVPAVKRIGLNVGSRDRWAAGQFLKNLIDNPGFEAGVYGMVAHVATGSDGLRIVQDFWDTSWNNDPLGIGQPVGFWDGADYEFVYGSAAGRSGQIATHTHENNRQVYYLDANGTVPAQWDVMFLRRSWDGVSTGGTWATADTSTVRPGSPGRQSLRMQDTGQSWRASYSFYMDSYWRDGDTTAGKLLPIEGNWRLELWVKGQQGGEQLRAQFFREGEANFIDQTVTLTTSWQYLQFDVSVAPGTDRLGPYNPGDYHPILGLSFTLPTAGSVAWIDDVALQSTDHQNPTVFTDAYVTRLNEARPGILRNWSNQFGSTLDVQLATTWGRGTQGFRPHQRVPDDYSYSIHEFLELCAEVEAEPWYIIPPTFTLADLQGLVEYLGGPADGAHPWADRRAALGQVAPWTTVFNKIHLEFGNELWGAASGGDPFFGASLLGGTRLGRIAHDRFAVMRASPSFDPARLDLVIGGQAGFPGRQQEIEAASSAHDSLALAPYFGELDDWSTDDNIFLPLLARPLDDVGQGRVAQSWGYLQAAQQNTELSVYEINFHTTSGSSPLAVRNDFVTSLAGALALPLHHLSYLRAYGARDQCAFLPLGYSYRMSNGEYARVWGMLRDLAATGRKRPTWLGVELINSAIHGDLLRTIHSGDDPGFTQTPLNGVTNTVDVRYLQSFAFGDGESLSLVLFNLNLTTPLDVSIVLPMNPTALPRRFELTSASIHDHNEDATVVTIQEIPVIAGGNPLALTLPRHSLTVLSWSLCAVAAIAPVASVNAVRTGPDVTLSWASDTSASGYNLWYVDTAPEIPFARFGGVGTLVLGCAPTNPPTCPHPQAVAPAIGTQIFYQARGTCGVIEAAE